MNEHTTDKQQCKTERERCKWVEHTHLNTYYFFDFYISIYDCDARILLYNVVSKQELLQFIRLSFENDR